MLVKVDICWTGHSFQARVHPPRGEETFMVPLPLERWTREAATKVLDCLEHQFDVKRRNVRFHIS